MTTTIENNANWSEQFSEYLEYMDSWFNDKLSLSIISRYKGAGEFFDNVYPIYESSTKSETIREIEGFSTDESLVGLFLERKDEIIAMLNNYTKESSTKSTVDNLMKYSGMSDVEVEGVIDSEGNIKPDEVINHPQLMIALALSVVSKYSVEYCEWRRRLLDRAGDDAAYLCAMEDMEVEILEEKYPMAVGGFETIVMQRLVINKELGLYVNDSGVVTTKDGTIIEGLDNLYAIASYKVGQSNEIA